MRISNEAKVGALVVGTLVAAFFFIRLIGYENPFRKSTQIYVTYRFAGGIDVGSAVRFSGIKVGQVEQIDFMLAEGADASKVQSVQEPGSDDVDDEKVEAPVRLKLSIKPEAAAAIRTDSRFYINLAGLIGDRYIEVTPGTKRSAPVQNGQTLAGVDPPRIDQLLSQSFDLAGKIAKIIEENKGDLARSIDLIYKLSANINKTLGWVDKSALFKTDLSKLVDNLIRITTDIRRVTDRTGSPEGKKLIGLIYDLLMRLEPLDSNQIRLFLQREGVKVHLFGSPSLEKEPVVKGKTEEK